MAVQSKTLIGDVGSAVLAESVSQSNRAAGYVSSTVNATLVNMLIGPNAMVLCKFTEDVYVTSVVFGFGHGGGAINHLNDSVGLFTGGPPNGDGGTPVCTATNFTVPFPTSDVWATMTDLLAVSDPAASGGSDAPFAVNAGDSLAGVISLDPASTAVGAVLSSVNVTYRPMKDYLVTSPTYTRTMQNFGSVDR
jgi:hypothetical protein